MKKGFLAVLAITTALFVTSCGKKGGLSEVTKAAMTTFETNWKATEANMTAMGTTMNTAFAEMTTMMKMDDGMDMSKMKPAQKASMDSMTTMCTMIEGQMEKMKGEYSAAMASWSADAQAYADWKKKASEEKMDDAAFSSELTNNWTAKLATYNEQLVGMNEQLTGIQAACKATCDAMAAMMMPAK